MGQTAGEQTHILVVEDEESMAEGLRINLEAEGYRVTVAVDGRQAQELISGGEYDLLILDIMLPFINGFDIASSLRARGAKTPILFLTALFEHESLIQGLGAGGDDFMTKPLHLDELLLRVQGMLRRKSWYRGSEHTAPHRFGPNRVDFETLAASSSFGDFQLTRREAELLKYLIEERGRTVNRSELLERVWNLDTGVNTRTVDNFIMRLRKYFEIDPSRPVYFISVRGAGYRFESTDLSVENDSQQPEGNDDNRR